MTETKGIWIGDKFARYTDNLFGQPGYIIDEPFFCITKEEYDKRMAYYNSEERRAQERKIWYGK
jgi:hypothetical protein